MSDIALPKVGTARRRSWRDAITPEGRASRRRWAVAYPALLCLGSFMAVTTFRDGGTGVDTLAAVALVIVFGMLRRSTRRVTALDHPELDERDRLARDRAFRLAYPLLLAVLSLTLTALAVLLPDATREVPATSGGSIEIAGSFLDPMALLGVALWLVLWAVFLPTGVLAWLEPDALEPDPGAPAAGPSDAARDGLLGGALAAGVVIGIVQDADVYALLPLAGALALLSRLARRPQ